MSKAKLWLGRLITLIAFYFVFRFISSQWESVSFSFNNNSIGYAAISLFSALVFFALRSLGWHKIIRQSNSNGTFITNAWFLAKSELLRYIPGNVWGLSARVLYAPQFGFSRQEGFIFLLSETILLVSSAGILSGVSLITLPGLDVVYRFFGIAVVISSVALLFLTKSIPFFRKKFSFFLKLLPEHSESPPWKLVRLIPLYVALWISFGLFHYLLFLAVFSNGPFFLLVCFSVIAWLAGYASLITPSGLGVREVVFGIGLSHAIQQGISHTFALISRLAHVVVELLWYFGMALLYGIQKK